MTAPAETPLTSGFAGSRAQFETLLGFLDGEAATALSHSELEDRLQADGRELLRRLFQDHLDLRADREQRIEAVVDAGGVPRRAAECGHRRALASVFGELSVRRRAYRRRGCANLHPADALLNLPAGRHSHGLRRLAAVEASRGSFDDAVEAIERALASASPSVKWRTSPRALPPTSSTSMCSASAPRQTTATCSSCPATARAS